MTHIDVILSAIPERKSALDSHMTSSGIWLVQYIVVFRVTERKQGWKRNNNDDDDDDDDDDNDDDDDDDNNDNNNNRYDTFP